MNAVKPLYKRWILSREPGGWINKVHLAVRRGICVPVWTRWHSHDMKRILLCQVLCCLLSEEEARRV